MTTLDAICTAPVLTASRDTTIVAAARMMREAHVGALVVVSDAAAKTPGVARGTTKTSTVWMPPGRPKPIGIVTDRDIVMAIVALDLDPNVFLLGDLLNRPLVTATAGLSIREGLAIMNAKGIRRLPLVNRAGELTGMVTLDDLIIEAARDLQQVASVIEREITSELALRPSRIRARQASGKKAQVAGPKAAAPQRRRTAARATARAAPVTPVTPVTPVAKNLQHLPFI